VSNVAGRAGREGGREEGGRCANDTLHITSQSNDVYITALCSGYVSATLHTAASMCNVFNNECVSYPGSFLRKGAWVRGYVCLELSVSFCLP